MGFLLRRTAAVKIWEENYRCLFLKAARTLTHSPAQDSTDYLSTSLFIYLFDALTLQAQP